MKSYGENPEVAVAVLKSDVPCGYKKRSAMVKIYPHNILQHTLKKLDKTAYKPLSRGLVILKKRKGLYFYCYSVCWASGDAERAVKTCILIKDAGHFLPTRLGYRPYPWAFRADLSTVAAACALLYVHADIDHWKLDVFNT